MSLENYGTFSEVRARLDEIVVEVRNKELPLEKSLDLYEEAIKLGNRCAELVDKSDFSAEEAAAARETISQEAPNVSLSGEASAESEAEDAPEAEADGETEKPEDETESAEQTSEVE